MRLGTEKALGRKLQMSSAVLAAVLLSSTGAWAQCTDTFVNYGVNIPTAGQNRPVQELLPLGRGSSLSALTATINTVNTTFLTSTSAFVSAPGNPEPDQQGGGVWGRAVGGSVTSKTTSTGTLDGIVVDPGRQTCHTTVRQDFEGYQVGHDVSVLNVAGTGANVHFGVTAGAVQARTKDITPAGAYTSPNNGIPFATAAGTFSETSQIPFLGLYAAFTKGGLFLDAQVRWDFFQNSLSDVNNGLAGQRLDARGFSITGNAGYNIPLHNNWFIEPSAGIVLSRVSVDPLSMSGVLQAGGGAFPYARGTVTVDDIDSALGRASVRIGTTFTTGNVAWQPYFTASVFHEFSGDVTVRSLEEGTGNAGIDGLTLTSVSKGGIGTYGQFALGTAAVLGNTGWLGYGRVDYRTGENIEGWSVTGGLRYQFTPGSAGSIKDGRAPAVYTYNWTGPYGGVYVGTQWGDQSWSFNNGAGPGAASDFAGTIIGGQVGYNLQMGKTVIGIEGEYGGSNARGGEGGDACPNVPVIGLTNFPFYTCEAEVNRLAALTGRVGFTWGRALFYAKGGVAAGDVTAGRAQNTPSPTAFGPGPTPVALVPGVTTSNWQVGWTAGVGMEFALTDRWSAKAEYSHYDLGRDTFTTFVGDPGTRVETRGDTLRVGINLHLNPVQREVPLK